MRTHFSAGQHELALATWQQIAEVTQLLFAEPSPAPAKHWLWRTGLIDSAEVRSPMVEVSETLAARLDDEIARRGTVGTEKGLVNAG